MKKKYIYFLLILTIVLMVFFFYIKSLKVKNSERVINHFDESANFIVNGKIKTSQLDVKKATKIEYSIPIFMYHFIRDDTGDYQYPENMVKPSSLKEQLKYLSENGYETIFVSDIDNLELYKKPVMLTFDDSWEDFYINAFPLLKEYNLKATLYVITSFVGRTGYCTLDELKEIKQSGLVDIQSHSISHPRLSKLPNEEIVKELRESKEFLKENLNVDVNTICYPYGDYSKAVIEEARNIGYRFGIAMTGGVFYSKTHKDLYQIPRIYLNRSMSINTFINYCKKSSVSVTW